MNIYITIRNILIVLVVSILPFIAAELLLRLTFPDKVTNMTRSRPDVLAYEFNKDYLVSLKPNVTKTFVRSKENGGDVIRWSTNSNAFRGPELMNNPGKRIIVYGDSNIQAEFSKDENTYVYKLGDYLRKDGFKDVEVLNAGVIGNGPDQSLIRFEKEVDIYKPDMVIFHVFPDNDFGDLVRNRLFELDANYELRKTNFKKTVDECIAVNNDHKWSDFLSSLLIVKATKKLLRLFQSDENKARLSIVKEGRSQEETFNELKDLTGKEYLVYKESQPRKFSHCDDHYDTDLALYPDKEPSRIKLKLMDAVLRAAYNLAESKGIAFLVVIQPSVVDMTKENAELGYEYPLQYPGYKRSNLTDAVKNLCVANNIPFVDLFDVFLTNSPESLFFRGEYAHWNDHGQDVAAKVVASYISNQMMSK